jgi:hypothetical protein
VQERLRIEARLVAAPQLQQQRAGALLTVPRIDRKRPPVPACKQACLHAGVTVLVQYRYRTGIPTVYRVYSRTAVLLAVTGGRSLGTVSPERLPPCSHLHHVRDGWPA